MKPKLYIRIVACEYWLSWVTPELAKLFDIVDEPSPDVAMLAYGQDSAQEALRSKVPSRVRVATFLPGITWHPNPVEDAESNKVCRYVARQYDVLFVNPGPLELAFADMANCKVILPSYDVDIRFRRRMDIGYLLHAGVPTPQKNRVRNIEIMRKTGLDWDVQPRSTNRLPRRELVHRYLAADAVIQVSRKTGLREYLEGKYTACMMEAGATGAILFWHDVWGLGSDFDCIVPIPNTSKEAAAVILETAEGDVEALSAATSAEIRKKCHPRNEAQAIFEAIEAAEAA